MLTDASEYGADSPTACLDRLNRVRRREHLPPLPAAPPADEISEEHLLAYVNHGRWVVDCPCGSAQLACRSDRRFFCTDCRNAWAFGKWVRVTWPAEEADIEALLLQRPFPRNRNWHPRESASGLAMENADNGVGA